MVIPTELNSCSDSCNNVKATAHELKPSGEATENQSEVDANGSSKTTATSKANGSGESGDEADYDESRSSSSSTSSSSSSSSSYGGENTLLKSKEPAVTNVEEEEDQDKTCFYSRSSSAALSSASSTITTSAASSSISNIQVTQAKTHFYKHGLKISFDSL